MAGIIAVVLIAIYIRGVRRANKGKPTSDYYKAEARRLRDGLVTASVLYKKGFSNKLDKDN